MIGSESRNKIKNILHALIPLLVFFLFLAITILISISIDPEIVNSNRILSDENIEDIKHHIQGSSVLIGGFFISLLLSAIAYLYTITSSKAASLAEKMTSELQIANSYRQAILDGSNYSIISTTTGGTIKSLNAASERMLGYKASELVDKQTPAIIHDYKEVVQRAKELSLELGKPIEPGFEVFVAKAESMEGEEREWTYIRKDKSRFPVRLSVTPIRNNKKEITGYLGIASDISEAKKSEQFVKLQYEITRIIVESTEFLGCLKNILQAIAKSMKVDFSALWQEDAANQVLFCYDFWCEDDPNLVQFGEKSKTIKFKSGVGLPGRIWKNKRLAIIQDIQDDPNFPRKIYIRENGLKSALGLPLFYEDRFIGVFEFLAAEKFHFNDLESANFVTWLGRILGMLIGRFEKESDLKRKEEENYKTSFRLKLATESAKIGIWEWDIATNQILWDEMMSKIYGEQAPLSTNPYEIWKKHLHPEDADKAEAALMKGVSGKKQFNTTFRIIWHDQTIHYIRAIANVTRDPEGNAIKMIGVNWDITEEKTAEQKLLLAIESSPTAIVMIDRKRTIVLINGRTENLFGYSREELLGQKLEILVPEQYRARHPVQVEQFFKDPSIRHMGVGKEVLGLKKNGENVLLEVTLTPIKTLEGVFTLASVIDLTEKKKTELIKSEFVSMVSHELRTPLTSVQGALGLIMAEDLSERIKVLIKIAYSNSDRLVHLINDLLDIEKIDLDMMVFKKENIDLRPLIILAVENNKNYALQFNVTLSFSDSSTKLFVHADADRIMQVLNNLISNAVKFSPKGGTVKISSSIQENGNIRINIQDEGPGVPEEFKKRIFQKFAQADSSITRKKGGTGLGLSICKAIIDKHGGLIDYEFQPGQGTNFYFELPLQKIETYPQLKHHEEMNTSDVPMTKIEATTPKISGDKPKILHIEDNRDVLFVVSKALKEIADLEQATLYAEAEKLLESREYDLVILDLVLPDGSGIDLLPLLNQKGEKAPPVIIFSVHEVDPSISEHVKVVLLKSKTSNELLRQTVGNILNKVKTDKESKS